MIIEIIVHITPRQFTYKELSDKYAHYRATALHNMGAHLGSQKEEGENHLHKLNFRNPRV